MLNMTMDCSSENLQELADALGASYDSSLGTIYKGTDPRSGFVITQGENSGYTIGLYGDTDNYVSVPGSLMYYENSGSCCVFGGAVMDTALSHVQCAIVPFNSSSGGGYLHIINLGRST